MCIDYWRFWLWEQISAKSEMVCLKCSFRSVLGCFQLKNHIFFTKTDCYWPIFMDGVSLSQRYQTSKGREFIFYHWVPRSCTESTLEPPRSSELGTPGFEVQFPKHKNFARLNEKNTLQEWASGQLDTWMEILVTSSGSLYFSCL